MGGGFRGPRRTGGHGPTRADRRTDRSREHRLTSPTSPEHENGRRSQTMRHGYLIDMDGVIYRGKQLIPGADRFVQLLRERQVPFRFLTNNSQRTRRDVAARLAQMGIDVEEE